MRRDELEHIIRAVGAILSERDIIIVGSQSILGQYPRDLPPVTMESIEADILPLDDPDGRKADMITGAIGEESPFHSSFNIWAHGVDESTSILPNGWQDRLIPVSNENTWGVTGHCLEVHDLLIAKYIAGRAKDLAFCASVVEAGLVTQKILEERLAKTDCTLQEHKQVKAIIKKHFSLQQR
ncbi:MAG TPA: DUF6036 family nucleotidyltransferase [Spirochaetia bacterium]|nr:DUF6036 family nucleotidyltransferase [Spirochaetia bacterium]